MKGDYFKYTGPARLDKAMHSLEGILRGIAADRTVNAQELSHLIKWIGEHREFSERHPFNEVISRLDAVLSDNVVDEEEIADMLWLCEKFTTDGVYYDDVSADMQRLQGIMRGIVADEIINAAELGELRAWLDNHEHLRTCWPYDELDALTMAVLADGIIDPKEHDVLVQFFKEFTVLGGQKSVAKPDRQPPLIHGICAATPQIEFAERVFCFTGESEQLTRRELAKQVEQLGGAFSNSVTRSVNYLIVGAAGNPCWAYACYGRKVEAAVALRKKGLPVLIVHEYDYFDAVADVR